MDKFEVVKELGAGNFGVARLIRHREPKELVAMKYIKREHKGKYIDSGDVREMGLKRQRLMDRGSSYYGTPPGPSYMYNTPPPPPPPPPRSSVIGHRSTFPALAELHGWIRPCYHGWVLKSDAEVTLYLSAVSISYDLLFTDVQE